MRELGRGGMATVFLARDLKHDRPVAIKLMHPGLAAGTGAERFLREIGLAARLQHPHILPLLDSGRIPAPDGDRLWYAMPYVEGESLRALLDRESQLPVPTALRIAREVADALEHAHRQGIVHRDIKPENILLSGGHALVADFGIARALTAAGDGRLTATGMTLGTPQYMSPEQAAGDSQVGPRADLYSLGCVLYEMLAGEPPHTGPNAQAVVARRLAEPAPRLATVRDTGPALDSLVARTLARTPADRFATASELSAALDSIAATAAVPTPVARRGPVRRRPLAIAAGAAVIAAAAWLGLRPTGPSRSSPTPSAAVLPFVNLDSAGDDWFSAGLSEELITRLSQVEGLRVAAHGSSSRYRGSQTDVREVGRALGVGSVLEGSVRRSGNRLRISARLVDTGEEYQLWAETYDRELTDVFAVQEEIARAIVEALRVELGVAGDTALAAVTTRDLAAYDLYLKGRFALNERSAASLGNAVGWFERAVAQDSGFARAWAGLADASVLLALYSAGAGDTAWTKGKHAAQRALALDGTLAEAHTALAYGTMIYEWNWPAAEAGFRRAIAANANYPTAHHWYGDFLAGRGRLAESRREMERAHALDPLSRIIGAELGWVRYLHGDNVEAMAQIRRTLALDPDFPPALLIEGLIHLAEGRPAEAAASLRRSLEVGGEFDPARAALTIAQARSGDPAEARRLLAGLERRAARGEFSDFALAIAYTGLGDHDRAIAALQRAIDARDIFATEIFHDPLLHPLRGDPRFGPIAAQME